MEKISCFPPPSTSTNDNPGEEHSEPSPEPMPDSEDHHELAGGFDLAHDQGEHSRSASPEHWTNWNSWADKCYPWVECHVTEQRGRGERAKESGKKHDQTSLSCSVHSKRVLLIVREATK